MYFTNQSITIAPVDILRLKKLTNKFKFVFTAMLEDKTSSRMLISSAFIALAMHILALFWLLNSFDQNKQQDKAELMQVSMISMTAQKLANPAPLKSLAPKPIISKVTPPVLEKKPLVRKPQLKPLPSKTSPAPKPTASAPPTATTEPTSAQAAQSATENNTETKAAATTAESEQFTEANYRANYSKNPKPEYPAIARSREWQGKVLLRVQVNIDGLSESVQIAKSSGHDVLDESAMEAVKKWIFIPAKRGNTPVASSVIVPMVFSLAE